ncbi:MAG: hypothetical protein NTW86_07375 [Candidatus Sumerlaeota bacterium]|nr:hypothetical protein [Candidatus Sumerlaeota bacterium]
MNPPGSDCLSPLTQEERAESVSNYRKYAFLNFIGYNFITENSIILLALSYGASNMQLGYLSSCAHIAGIAALFAPIVLANRRIIRVAFYAWFTRAFVCLFYLLTIFFHGQSAVAIILVVFTAFNVLRTVVMAMADTINRILARPEETGSFIARMSAIYTAGGVISNVISFIVLSFKPLNGSPGLLVLVVVGVVFNTLGTNYVRRMKIRERIPPARGFDILATFARACREQNTPTVFVLFALNLALNIFLGFTLAFLRRVVHCETNIVFLYIIMTSIIGALASYGMTSFIDHTGNKPVLILTALAVCALTARWGLLPASLPRACIFLLGAATAFFLTIHNQAMGALVLQIIPDRDKTNFSFLIRFLSSTVALAAGFLSGMVANLGRIVVAGLHPFSFVFFAAALITLICAAVGLLLRESRSLSVLAGARFLLSSSYLREWFDLSAIINPANRGPL